jgi:hypothetical protein
MASDSGSWKKCDQSSALLQISHSGYRATKLLHAPANMRINLGCEIAHGASFIRRLYGSAVVVRLSARIDTKEVGT